MSANPEAGALSSCDPLAAETTAIELGTVLGAGEAADGTVYVIDKSGNDLRAFISENGELYRQHVAGSGELNDEAGETTVLTLSELSPPLILQVVVSADGSARMGVVEGEIPTKTFTIGEQGEELSMLGADDVAQLALHNYPAEVVKEYVAEVEGGRLLVVLRPRELTDYEEFRVFFGAPEQLRECPVTDVSRAKDGGSTQITFTVDGKPAEAYFPVEFVGEQFVRGTPTLTIDDAELEISLSDAGGPAADAGYLCLAPQR